MNQEIMPRFLHDSESHQRELIAGDPSPFKVNSCTCSYINSSMILMPTEWLSLVRRLYMDQCTGIKQYHADRDADRPLHVLFNILKY